MKSLVVYYSRTGNTRKIAEKISSTLDCEIEEIFDTKKRNGPIGYMGAAKDAKTKKLTKLKDIKNDPAAYDRVIIGTPIWAWTISTPIRTYLTNNNKKLRSVAFFCTHGGNPGTTFEEMEDICKKKPVGILEISGKEMKAGTDDKKLKEFVKKIKS